MFIYLIVNHATGKYYVGQHKGNNLKKYLHDKLSHARHKTSSHSYLFRSMRKHPKEAWSIHALLSDIQTKTELDKKEKDFIEFLRSRDPEYGYNICRGGEGHTGTFSSEHRARLRAKRLLQPDPRLGTHHSEESKKRMADANKGKIPWMKGKRHTDEAKEKCRQGGLVGGRKAVESGQLYSIRGLGGRKAVESGQVQALGFVQGRRNVENGLLARLRTPEHQMFAIHTRWHVKRGITNPNCRLCSGIQKASTVTL